METQNRRFLPLIPAVALLVLGACGPGAAPTATAQPKAPATTAAPPAGAAATATRAPTAPAPTAAPTPTRAAVPTATAAPVVAKPSGKVTIVIADAGAQHLDPHQLVGGAEGSILNFMFEGLLGYDLDGTLEGRLATSWSAKENASIWEFKLRPGVKHHNGDPLIAEDVKFSFEKASKDIGNVSVQLRTSGFDSAEVADPQTVRIKLKGPSSIFEDTGGPTGIEPKGYVERVGPQEFARAPVGTGPYKFVSRRLDEFASFEAFDGHWRQPAFVKEVTLRFAAEPSVRLAMLKAGEVDIVGGVTPTQAQEIRGTAGLRTISAPGTSMMWMWPFGASKIVDGKKIRTDSPWSNKLVRQAANYAIDREAIVKGIFRGDAAPMVTVVMPGAFGFNPNLKPYPYDPKKAKELLAQAGYPSGFTTDLYATPHAAISFTEDTTVAVAKFWADIGIKADIKKMDYGTYLAQVRDRKIDGIGVIATVFQPNSWSTLNNYFSARSWPSMMWDPSVDAALDKAAAESDRSRRQALLQELVAQEHETAANVFLVYGNTTYGVNARIKDWPQQRGYGYVARADLLQLVR